jgi:hypothetical protein
MEYLTSVSVRRAFLRFFLAAHTAPLLAPIFHYLDSWLNPIEPHFTSLRKFAISNSNPRSHEEIARSIRRFIAWRNRHHPEPSPPRKRGTKEKRPRLCRKCGIIILEEH